MKILILGGYGTFGGRLAELLADVGGLDLLIAGRSMAKAREFCDRWQGAARVRPVRAERSEIGTLLEAERPAIVVDASGPFQDYGSDPYSVVRAALAVGADYLDLADGAEFVAGIGAFDAEARASGRFVLAGASSFPVLTAAVLAEMRREIRLDEIEGGIAPSPHALMGVNVLRAVLGYAGAPVRLTRGGRPTTGLGLSESRMRVIAPPGTIPLRPSRFSLVDVPDLRALPALWPEIRTLWMGAAPRPEPLLRLLNLLARLRARRLLPNLAPLAPICRWLLGWLHHGEHRGGMYVAARGPDATGQERELSWHLIAEGDDGPMIPAMAAEGLIHACLAGQPPAPGARAGAGALTLDDYARLFARRRITTGWRREARGDRPRAFWRLVMVSAYRTLPPPIAALHDGSTQSWSGRGEAERGRGPVAWLISTLFGFPKPGRDLAVRVELKTDDKGVEHFTRHWPGRPMRSYLSRGTGRDRHHIVERFGPVSVAFAPVLADGRLDYVTRHWRLGPLPLPRALLPGGHATETIEDGRFRFDVEIRLPLVGRIVRYRGWLMPERPAPPAPKR